MSLMAAHHQTSTEDRARGTTEDSARNNCCPLYHEAVELVGRRWTGAILRVLMDGPLRFSEIAQAIPELSDRLLSERMKELEARGMVQRTVVPGPPLQVRYQLSRMGSELEPALTELEDAFEGGMGFDGSSITGFNAIEESDMIAQPDPSTFIALPWRPNEAGVARMFCDILTPERTPYEGDPRHVLRRAIQRAEG